MTRSSPRYLHIVVHSPALDGSRRVTGGDVILGVASHLDDVLEILRLAEVDPIQAEESDLVEWQGGGPHEWPGLSRTRPRCPCPSWCRARCS
ncbi:MULTISPECIES: hypothetical protein [unclassified Streptomyces]|uniref:hypothetical protein n=1 Tax=unclassified Streptomyces TaxID=2593676 RepID=UPI00099DC054|nr:MULTISPECIES: hypothetical protein [unclassified Streptomyces]